MSGFQGLGGATEHRPLHQPPSPKQKDQMVRESQPLPPRAYPHQPLSPGLSFVCGRTLKRINSLHSSLLCVKQPNLLLHYNPPHPRLHFLPFCLRQFPVVRGLNGSTRLWGGAERGWRQSLVRGAVIHICCKASKGLGVVVLVGVQVWIAKKDDRLRLRINACICLINVWCKRRKSGDTNVTWTYFQTVVCAFKVDIFSDISFISNTV